MLSGNTASSVPEQAFSRKATKIEDDVATETLSKRQAKLAERAKKGPIRIGQQPISR